MEEMEQDYKIQVLQEMENHPAWKLYQDHLDKLCRIKEVEKSKALRQDKAFEASARQHEIDGINLVVKSIFNKISSLSPKTETELT